jgi:RHS repeat-associated protein
LGHTSKVTFDQSGNVLSRSVQVGSSTLTSSYTYNSFGEVLTSTDPLGNTTTNTYDGSGNLLSTTTPSPDGTKAGNTTTFTYDAKGELIAVTDPRNNKTTLAYTPAGLPSTITDAQNHVFSFTYDPRGNRTTITDPLGQVTKLDYDVVGRLTKVTMPDNSSGQLTYDSRGRQVSVAGPDGKISSFRYNDADQLLSATDPLNATTQYSYDADNNLISITDALNRSTTFAYDSLGQMIQTVYPSGLQESYVHDANGNLTSRTLRGGQTIKYGYDEVNRLVSKSFPDGSSVSYAYDNDGRLTQVADATGTYQFTYDGIGQLTGTTTSYAFLPGRSFTVSYAYDPASDRTGMTDAQGGVTNYGYDSLGRLTKIANSSNQQFGLDYDALNRLTQLSRPNGLSTLYSYDPMSRLQSVLHQNTSAVLDGATYTMDITGARTGMTDKRTGIISSYAYDPDFQLTQVISGGSTTERYTYDLMGNRLSSIGTPQYTYNSSNELTSMAAASYTYDKNGNPLTKTDSTGVTTFTWDFENQLTAINLPTGSTISFKYDPFGRRVAKTSATGTTIYVYDGLDIIDELDGAGNILASYTQGPGTDQPLAMVRGGTTSYYEADAQGSITSLSDSTGALVNTYSYDSFGNPIASEESVANPFRYTARELDLETGYYYYRARYYDSSLGRFLNEDPIHFGGGTNFYAYVDNNAVNDSDPMGLFPPWFHYQLTESAASEAFAGKPGCQNKVQEIANADKEQDLTHGAKEWWQNVLGQGEAWAKGGVHFPSQALLTQEENAAFSACDAKAMGKFLHSFQDSQAHIGGRFGGYAAHPWLHWVADVPYIITLPIAKRIFPETEHKYDSPYSPPDYDAINDPERLQNVWDNTTSLLKSFARRCPCCNK